MTSFFSVLFMALGLGAGADGGATELLDLTSPKIYFEAQSVAYEVAELIEIVEAPATRKLDQEKPQEVAKLLAMRGLAELGDKAALPALQKMLKSKHRFYAEHAKAAIAQIEGNEYVRPAADAAAMDRDLALLPPGLAVMMQCRPRSGMPVDVMRAASEFAKLSGGKGKAEKVLKRFNRQAADIAEMIGNVRFEGVTFGASGDETDGGELLMVAIVRGRYDSKAAEAMLSEIDGARALNLGGIFFVGVDEGDYAIAPLSDDRLIYIEGWEEDNPNFQEFLKRLKTPPAAPKLEPAMAALVRKSKPSRLWAAMLITDYLQEDLPEIGAFEHILMASKKEKPRKSLTLTFSAQGKTEAGARKIAGELMDVFEELKEELKAELPDEPRAQGAIDWINGIKSKVDGKMATFTITLDRRGLGAAALLVQLFEENF